MKEQLKQDYGRIKSQIPQARAAMWILLTWTVALGWCGWYITAILALFGARFFFGVICSYKDFLRWADLEMEKLQRVDDLRPKQ